MKYPSFIYATCRSDSEHFFLFVIDTFLIFVFSRSLRSRKIGLTVSPFVCLLHMNGKKQRQIEDRYQFNIVCVVTTLLLSLTYFFHSFLVIISFFSIAPVFCSFLHGNISKLWITFVLPSKAQRFLCHFTQMWNSSFIVWVETICCEWNEMTDISNRLFSTKRVGYFNFNV